MQEHILARRLEGDNDDIAEHLAAVAVEARLFVEDNRMVVLVDDFLIDNALQQPKIHHHTEFWGRRGRHRLANHRYKQLITMTVKAAALAVVIVERVSRLK
jgi:hypothetical protein